MGLLGDSIEDPRTMAVLRLAGALQNQRGGGFGGLLSGLNAGGQDYIQTIAAAKQQEEARKQEALKQQLLAAQIQETQAQAQQRQEVARHAQAQAQRDAQFTQDLSPPPITGTQAAAMPGGISPANAARIGTQPAVDWVALARKHPDKVDLITKMAGMQDVGRREVARTVDGADEAGNPVTFQYSKHGDLIGTAIRKPIERKFLNTGGSEVAYNPFALSDGQTIKRTATPDALLSADTARRGQNMADARGRESNAISMQNGKIPPGYRMKMDGTLEAIPGGPADIKAGELGAKAEAKRESQLAASQSVRDTVKEAASLVGHTTAGVGSWMSVLPATDSRNLSAKLETIKSNLGFDRLQQMRDQSPTGGALGAVAVQELTALQSTVASLDQAQSPSQLKAALAKIDRHYGRWQSVMRGQVPDSGATGTWDTAPQPAKPAAAPTMRWNPKTGTFDMIGG